MTALADALRDFGADAEGLCSFDTEGPRLLPYASMLTVRGRGESDLSLIEGVYEWQNEPLAFLVDGNILGNDERRLHRLRRLLAMRGDAPYLAVYTPGTIDFYRVTLDSVPASQARVDIDLPKHNKASTFAYLANSRPGLTSGQPQWIAQVILSLLSSSIDRLKQAGGVNDDDAISLVGRALFARFLADRHLIPKSIALTAHDVGSLFDNSSKALATSAWLDRTFNGDFLPLTKKVLKALPPPGFNVLGDIMRKAPDGQLFLGWEERWGNLDFAHIPVGVLSQAYEHYLRKHAPNQQRKEGGYYTPRMIADLMVRGAFAAGSVSHNHSSKILDPAAGAGVFLLTAFRELVAARWRHEGARPETKTLREILYRQVVGFDINESALRFAALGLYLISIELDPHPEPVRKLRFKNLRGTVLIKVARGRADKLGSLGPAIGVEHNGKYDLVIGNPPWASGTGLPGWSFVGNLVKEIAAKRLSSDWGAPPLPNEVLDLPFVWRAMEWAKPGAQIVFALHGRLLFQQGDGMRDARRSLFAALDVSAVVNSSELRQTNVWPEVSAPFCLLYARNRVPPPGGAFRFVTPRLENSLNEAGLMRVDAQSAGFVTSSEVVEQPHILKILARGNDADLEVFRSLRGRSLVTLRDFWIGEFGSTKNRPQFTGNGYQRLRPSSRIRRNGDGRPGVDAGYLRGMPEITSTSVTRLLAEDSSLSTFAEKRIHDPRQIELFRGPLLILHKSPPADSGRIQMTVSDKDVVFNETYYGYSASTHRHGQSLVRYLALILSSQIAIWLSLILSGEFGFEREVIEKATIDQIPIPPFTSLTSADRGRADELFIKVATEPNYESWREVNEWVATLYGLTRRDLQAITDTLAYNLPFAENQHRAQALASVDEVEAFRRTLIDELAPWAQRFGQELAAVTEKAPSLSPWGFVRLTVRGSKVEPRTQSPDWSKLLALADELAATELILEGHNSDDLWIARLVQARYWSKTAARRVSQRVIWKHVQWLRGYSSS